MRSLVLLLLISFGAIQLGLAQNGGINLLTISPSSYALSKAEATTSIPDGSGSIYSNPALLVYEDYSSLDLSYTLWVANIQNIFGGINFLRENSALAFSFYNSGADDYEQYNRPGPSNGNFSVQYLSLSTAYAYKLNNISLGVSAHYLREEVYTYAANGYAFNVGIAAQMVKDRINLGLSLNNLGEMEALNTEPTTVPGLFKMGISGDVFTYTHPKNNTLPLTLAVSGDYVHRLGPEGNASNEFDSDHFNFAVLLKVSDIIELSSGYRTGETARPVSLGISLLTGDISFNYSLLPFETGFGTAHSLGIQYKF